MKILLIGASSYVGARIYFDLHKEFEITGTYFSHQFFRSFIPLDITDEQTVLNVVKIHKPDYIIHVANNANAGWCEKNPVLAKKLNQDATQHIVDAANKNNSKVIYISSFAIHSPSTVYGQTKIASEQIVHTTSAGWIIIRPSLVLGISPNTINDRTFNRMLKSIDEKKIGLAFDTSWQFQPTYIGHISQVIQSTISKKIHNKIFSVVIDEIVSRYQIAHDIFSQFNIQISPVDEKSSYSLIKENVTFFEELGIKSMNYKQFIETIVEEIRERKRFVL